MTLRVALCGHDPRAAGIAILLGLAALGGCDHGDNRISLAEMQARQAALDERVPVEVKSENLALTDFRPYALRAGDVLVIRVLGLQTEDPYAPTEVQLRVHADGQINMPQLGALTVAGLTLGEVEQLIAERMAAEITREEPTVYAQLFGQKPTTVLVMGAVAQPGVVALAQNERNPIYALQRAGGFGPSGSGRVTIKPIRPQRSEVSINLNDINDVRLALLSADCVLESGDVVVVESADTSAVYVSGLVNMPGPIPLPSNAQVSVLRAIASAGGIQPYLDVKEATLVRQLSDGEQVQVKLELDKILRGETDDLPLYAGDILRIPHTPDTLAQEWFRNNILVGPFSVGLRYDILSQYNTERAIRSDDNSFGDSIRDTISTGIPSLFVPPVTQP